MKREQQRYESLTRRERRQLVVAAVVRALATVGVLVAAYYAVPLDKDLDPAMVAGVVLGGAALTAVIAWQVRTIATSPNPGIRAVEALAFTLPVFVLLFAMTYVVISNTTASSFSEPLSRSDALYFAMTTLATVGYGDITAVSNGARLVVTVQMLLDLLLVGIVLHLFMNAVKRGRRASGRDR